MGVEVFDNPTITAKMKLIRSMIRANDAMARDERPMRIHVSAHRLGERPRDFGTVTVDGLGEDITAMIDGSDVETALIGMVLSMYADALVLVASATRADCRHTDGERPNGETTR